ncbi:hypothetical protein B4113_0001 [Geobacillus sp. B4113_201601]|nr:hypothetical protein B4113_0001 [Geobacillus sp. B4113_201601]
MQKIPIEQLHVAKGILLVFIIAKIIVIKNADLQLFYI